MPGTVKAARPYFRVQQGDVSTGGWFSTTDSSCVANQAPYQSPTHKADGTIDDATKGKGGIFAYGTVNGSNISGAKTDLAAYSLGVISGKDNPSATDEPYGFTSGGGKATLSFANYINFGNPPAHYVGANVWGGLFEGANPQAHCIPDYFDLKQRGPDTSLGSPINDLASLSSSKQYLINGDLTISSTTKIAVGQKITIFVKGNVYISKQIVYDGGYDITNVPRFSLIAKGSIYVDPSVGRLDGLYIAQPDPTKADVVTADTGVFWSCHGSNPAQTIDAAFINSCSTPLVVNGAVIAKQLNLLRSAGDVSNSTTAEIFNFGPEVIAGGPYFGDNSALGNIESVLSLPPIF